jgi:uncharacterized membrane protein
MDLSENNGEKVTPSPTSFSPLILLTLLIIVAQVLISLGTYPFLPDSVPSHWNAAGQVNGYLPKWINAVLYPAISLGLHPNVQWNTRSFPL